MRLGKNAKINRCDVFLALWVIYYLQGILYEEGGILSTGILGVQFLISIICAYKITKFQNLPVYFVGLNVLLLLFTIYGFAHIIMNPGKVYYLGAHASMPSYNYIKTIYLSLLPIYPFYYYSIIGLLNNNRLKCWFFVFFVSCTLTYFRMQRDVMALKNVEEITNNSGYLFLSLFPGLVLFRKNSLLHFFLILLLAGFIVLGMKRGAVLIAAIVLIYYFLVLMKTSRAEKKVGVLFLIASFTFLGLYFIEYRMSNSDYMMDRIYQTMEGNSSHRDDLYIYFYNHVVNEMSTVKLIMGNGANATLKLFENYAHNDWLEIAINQGLFGVLIYFLYWLLFYRTWKITTNSVSKIGIAMFGIIYFSKTFFSMSYGDLTYLSSSFLGFYLAMYKS